MARRKINPLDATLDNIIQAALAASKLLKKKAKTLEDDEDYSFLTIVAAIEKISRASGQYVEQAPLLQLRQNLESIENVILWLNDSTECTGEERERVIDILKQYQTDVLEKTGYYTPSAQLRMF